ncbi:LysR family transcriptional regulator [Leucobacter luti]|nr:LysR family transcriptional regulator [Leucobacter luti]
MPAAETPAPDPAAETPAPDPAAKTPAPDPGADPEATPAADPAAGSTPLRLGFARGIAPSTWAQRWETVTGAPLELAPVNVAFGRPAQLDCDVMLERALPDHRPAGSSGEDRTRHALRLYTETITLVVPADHELAKRESLALSKVADVHLLDHPFHPEAWPAAQPWADPSWTPRTVPDALALVATGAGAILLPTLLARHLVDKRQHAMIPVTDADELPRTAVWASWAVERDAPDVQQLIGVIRGRTARSSRSNTESADAAEAVPAKKRKAAAKPAKSSKPGPKPGSRGAQLAATRKKPPHRRKR